MRPTEERPSRRPLAEWRTPEARLELYRRLVLIRRFEQRVEALYPTDVMRTPVHLCIGQEAIPVGVCALLAPNDKLFSNYRGHGHYLAKGGDLSALVRELFGRATGCSSGKGGSMHLVDPAAGLLGSSAIVAGGVPHAVGSALASKLEGDGLISVTVFGDAATEQGVSYESLNFAIVHRLPVLFVCENNRYAINAPIGERAATPTVAERFSGLRLTAFTADGNDVDAVLDAADRAVAIAAGGGPALLECHTMLMRDHVGVGAKAKRKLLGGDWAVWEERDPLGLYRARLIGEGVAPADLEEIDRAVVSRLDDEFRVVDAEPLPAVDELTGHVFR